MIPDAAMAPWYMAPEMTSRPEWTELRVPYREDSKLERRWSLWLMPFRALALGFLWVTYQWYRTAFFLGTVLLVCVVFVAR